MKRYGMIAGMGADSRYTTLTQSPGLLKYISEYGADNPARAMEYIDSMVKGFDILAGYSEEPQDNYPVAVRYAPLHLSGKDEYFQGTKPFYVLHMEGEDYREGKRTNQYSLTVFLDKQQLLSDEEYGYLDQLLGLRGLSNGQMNLLRSRKSDFDHTALPAKCSPRLQVEDTKVVFPAVEALLSGRKTVIRVDRKQPFNDRAFCLLEQIYSLLPPKLAVETGFATYMEPTDVRRISERTGIKLYIMPADELLDFVDKDALILDLSHPETLPACSDLMGKSLTAWARLSWEERQEALKCLFAAARSWDSQTYIRLTKEFFTDPFFQFKPTAQNLTTLEELMAQFETCMVFRYNIGWITKQLRLYVQRMVAPNVNLLKLKAEAVVKARAAESEQDRRKYTGLYRFADVIAPGDASSYAVLQAQSALEETIRSQTEASIRQAQEETTRVRQDMEKQNADLRQAHQKAMADQRAAHQKTMDEQKAAHQKALVDQKKLHEKALADARKSLEEEQAKAKASAAAVASGNQQMTVLRKQMQEQKESHEAELRRMKEQQQKAVAEAGKNSAAAAQVASLQKQIQELQAAREADRKKLEAAKQANTAPAKTATGGEKAISEKAKQMVASQLLRNLALSEQVQAKHRAELAALQQTR